MIVLMFHGHVLVRLDHLVQHEADGVGCEDLLKLNVDGMQEVRVRLLGVGLEAALPLLQLLGQLDHFEHRVLVLVLGLEERVNGRGPLIRVQPGGKNARGHGAPIVADPGIPQQAPLLAVVKQPPYLLLSTELEHVTALEYLVLQAVEALQVVLFLDDPLELVVDLHVVKVKALLEGTQ